MAAYALQNPIKKFSWGDTRIIPELLSLPNAAMEPWAELWMGAYPSDPSKVLVDGSTERLDALLKSRPEETLGANVRGRFGETLPFLLKCLAIAKPMSLKSHPSRRKAEQGYGRETAAGIPLDAPERVYRDANPKPELFVAIGGLEALCGFKPIAEIVRFIRELTRGRRSILLERLEANPSILELSIVFYGLLSMPMREKCAFLERYEADATRFLSAKPDAPESDTLRWFLRLASEYPADIGAVAPIFFNYVSLAPYEALYVAPGEIHSWLSGFGMEVSANSSNELRGGLTNNHLDTLELLSSLSFSVAPPHVFRGTPGPDGFTSYACPAEEFLLEHAMIGGTILRKRDRVSPEILFCASGRLEFRHGSGQVIAIGPGESLFVEAATREYALSGDASLFRVTVP